MSVAVNWGTGPISVSISGAEDNLGSRVLAGLEAEPSITLPPTTGSIDVVVHLGSGDPDARARRRENVTEGVDRTLAEAIARDADHLVFVSSAMVYGAWPNNPVPLTEDAILRPDVDFVYARQLAAAEAMADRWRRQRPGRTVAVLRPVVSMAADGSSHLARSLAAGLGERFGEVDPAAQFLHLDDLGAAVILAVNKRLDGVFNVAPDGWIAGERVRALSGERPRLKLPDRVAEVVAALRWRFQRGPIPPGLRSYTRHSWVVANDRLKQQGWAPTVTNEQAYVEGTEGRWWTMVTPRRRQEIALGAMIGGALIVAGGALLVVRSWRRRRRAG
ncbi:MAG TPA: NAD-dependent epimerase/dehydratase family protein [Desertimonas sp.]|nr:NAD-dependent epimerase/dehydratase family protein [Desertimonas sp.]